MALGFNILIEFLRLALHWKENWRVPLPSCGVGLFNNAGIPIEKTMAGLENIGRTPWTCAKVNGEQDHGFAYSRFGSAGMVASSA
jgi:hypothetical protein